MNPADVAKYLRTLAATAPLDPTDKTILKAAANIIIKTVEDAIKDDTKK